MCRSGHVPRVEQLLKFGVPATGDHQGRGFVTIACEAGQLDVLAALLKAGGAVGGSDLGAAIRSGSVPTARRVLEELRFARAEYDFWSSDRPFLTDPAFLRAATPEMVGFLLASGADPTERDRNGRDAVSAAERAPASPEVLELVRAAARRRS